MLCPISPQLLQPIFSWNLIFCSLHLLQAPPDSVPLPTTLTLSASWQVFSGTCPYAHVGDLEDAPGSWLQIRLSFNYFSHLRIEPVYAKSRR